MGLVREIKVRVQEALVSGGPGVTVLTWLLLDRARNIAYSQGDPSDLSK